MGVPVKIGQQVMVPVHGISHEAEGVGRCEGFTVFVPDALPGDTVLAEIISVKPNYARALIRDVVVSSPDRITPPCPYFGECGGCQLMHASYAAQLRYKEEQVRAALQRIGGVENVVVKPIIPMSTPYNYRNKAQFPVGLQAGQMVMGCYKRRSHEIVPVDNCLIQHEASNAALIVVGEVVARFGVSTYEESTHTGLLRHVLVRHAVASHETMVVLVINGETLPLAGDIAREIIVRLPSVVSVQLNINRKRGNVILGEETRLLQGRDHILDEIAGLKFKVSARSFLQVNPVQTEVLYGKVREYAALTGRENVFDIYSGVGTIGLALARDARHVTGIEIVREAIADAQENARQNGITNASFVVGAAEDVVPELIRAGQFPHVCVIDPPRAGCDERLLEVIAAARPERIVYVSCNPSTLARDLRYLSERGYRTVEVQPVDMFPHTCHVECCCLLMRTG
ncbi:MAG: 23S rRNA (uracil-C(5))-methyltransferase RlmCD [Firmicutes bacterium]|nr:23S rRNA (uracil-C(5))-methyltransferase RlmCD [Bacillota bacterium]